MLLGNVFALLLAGTFVGCGMQNSAEGSYH
jgi:hypothetical protein